MGLTRKQLEKHIWGFRRAPKKDIYREKKVTFLNTPISLKLSRQEMELLREKRELEKELGEVWD